MRLLSQVMETDIGAEMRLAARRSKAEIDTLLASATRQLKTDAMRHLLALKLGLNEAVEGATLSAFLQSREDSDVL